jgi:VCBS repeat-containing protein
VIVGAYRNYAVGSSAGAAYVVYGGAAGPVNLDDVALGAGGFKINGEAIYDYAGWSVAGAGDTNNDGIDDVIVGAYRNNADGSYIGAAYVVHGQATLLNEDVSVSIAGANLLANDSDGDGDTLTISAVSATSAFGATVILSGDDIIYNLTAGDAASVAAFQALAEGESLADSFTYTISDGHGKEDTAAVAIEIDGVTDPDQVIAGSVGDDTLFGADGDDTLIGDGGDDLFIFVNGAGDDVIDDFGAGAATEDRLDISDFALADLLAVQGASTDIGLDMKIQLDVDDSVTLVGVNFTDLHADDFIFS